MPSYAQILSEEALSRLERDCVQKECLVFENWHFKNGDPRCVRSHKLFPSKEKLVSASGQSTLADWFDMKEEFVPPQGSDKSLPAGGLRILLSECSAEQWIFVSPFANFSLQNTRLALDKLHVPPSIRAYVHNIYRQTSELTLSYNKNQQIYTCFVTGSRAMGLLFSLNLLYDPESCTTTALIVHDNSANWQQRLTDRLRLIDSEVMHPLLLPTVLYEDSVAKIDVAVRKHWITMSILRQSMGLKSAYAAIPNDTTTMPLREVHSTLLIVQDYFKNSAYDFLKRWSDDLRTSFASMKKPEHSDQFKLVSRGSESLFCLFTRMRECFNAADAVRTDTIDNNTMIQNSLLSLMQREMAEAVRRDSSSMKTIAVVTMVFLPGTAVAAIFSMNPFFVTDNQGHLSVKGDFYWYWVVTLPLTVLAVGLWMLWMRLFRQTPLQEMTMAEAERYPNKHLASPADDLAWPQRSPKILDFRERVGSSRRLVQTARGAAVWRRKPAEVKTPMQDIELCEQRL